MNEPTAMPDNLAVLRTDAIVAREIKDAMETLLADLCAVLDRARAAGMTANFRLDADGFGRYRIAEMTVVKPL